MFGIIKRMDGYFINLNSSTLKVGLYNGQDTPRFISEDLLPTALSHSRIIDPGEFSREFSRMLAVHLGDKLPKLPLYFVLEPEVTDLFLVTTKKNNVSDEELIKVQIKERLVDENLDDLYYAYFKIAPFIYQFVGIKKDYMQSFLEIGNILGLEIGGVFPLSLLLAKSNGDVSSMFVFPSSSANAVVFSELTGVTFAEKFDGKIALNELKDLFWKLSVYNTRHDDVNVYTFAKYEHLFNSQKVFAIENGDLENNFEEVDIAHKIITKQESAVSSQNNLLNILPVPQTVETSKVPVAAMAGVASLVVIGGLILQLTVGLESIFSGIISANQGRNQEVLSKADQTIIEQTPAPTPTPQKEVKRTDLKLRVENGNGVAGSAGKLKEYLEGFGYSVVSVGNADKSDYSKTTVKLPKELANYKDLLSNDLKTNYSVEIADVSAKQTDYDVLVIVGLN